MTSAAVALSPAEGLIARHITYWIGVAERGKGGSKDHLGRGWTYLAAWDIQERVLALDFVALSRPTIYRALNRLVELGWFVREKLNAGRYRDHTYHYTFGAAHPGHRAEAETVAPPPENRSSTSGNAEVITVTTPILSIPPDLPPTKTNGPNDQEEERTREENKTRSAVTPEDHPRPRPIEPTTPDTSVPLVTTERPLVSNRRLTGLAAIAQRCLEMGGFSRWEDVPEPEPISPRAIISKDGTRLNVCDGVTAPLR